MGWAWALMFAGALIFLWGVGSIFNDSGGTSSGRLAISVLLMIAARGS